MISLYGILISLAILICILLAEKLTSKKDLLWGGAFWGIVSALLGARIYHVLSAPPYYLANPLETLYFWHGGLGIWGAIAGGTIGFALYYKFHHENLWYWLDLGLVFFPLGQAIGRWGNFFNNEIYGLPTGLPWGIIVNGTRYHPLFLYESILDLALFSLLYFLYKTNKGKLLDGFFLFAFLGGYSIIRFWLEFLRIDSWQILGLNVSQTISILLILVSLISVKRFIKNDLHCIRPRRV